LRVAGGLSVKNEAIINEEVLVNSTFDVEGIDVDDEGRVNMANVDPETYSIIAAPKPPTPPANTNCNHCNIVAGCGTVNMVKGCGSRIRGYLQ
jgi:hypothetical protein